MNLAPLILRLPRKEQPLLTLANVSRSGLVIRWEFFSLQASGEPTDFTAHLTKDGANLLGDLRASFHASAQNSSHVTVLADERNALIVVPLNLTINNLALCGTGAVSRSYR
jgi:hypothetical protein